MRELADLLNAGGLQVYGSPNRVLGNLDYDDDTAEWMWVRPKKGCAIVNLGDAAVKFTNGVLCSGRHRVIPSPGEQGKWPRYSRSTPIPFVFSDG